MVDIPESVETELGLATVGVVKPHNATKDYLCPLCDELISLDEKHVIIVPLVKSRLRRHAHTDCLIQHIKYGVRIKLHPNEPNMAQYNF